MRCAIADTICPEAGVVRNNDCVLLELVYSGTYVDPDAEVLEIPPGTMPDGVFVRVNGCSRVMVPGREPGVVYLRPWSYVGGGVRRRNIPTLPLATATDFFAEGATIRPPHRVLLDLLRPAYRDGHMARASIIVAVSRVTSWDEVFLLRPLWTADNEAEQCAYYRYVLLPGLDLALFTYDLKVRAGIPMEQAREDFRIKYLRLEGEARRAMQRFRRR